MDQPDHIGFLRDNFQRVAVDTIFFNHNLAVAVRIYRADIMSFGNRGFPTTPQNAFSVFQIIISSGDLHLKKFAFIFFLKVK